MTDFKTWFKGVSSGYEKGLRGVRGVFAQMRSFVFDDRFQDLGQRG